MLEPEPYPTTSDTEIEPLLVSNPPTCDLNQIIIAERNRDVKQIEQDIEHMSAAQKMLAKIVQEQSQQVDQIEANTSEASSMLKIANTALAESEKMANRRRKRNIIVGVVGGVVALGVIGSTTVSVLKSQGKF